MFEPISELAEINPPLRAPVLDRSDDLVSFIPMGDVSESGQWLTHKTRPLREVKSGFTPFQEGDVLIAKITPCMENGKGAHAVGLENGVGYGSTEFHVLRAKAENSPRYIFHISQSSSLRLKAEASMIGSAGQKRVPSEFFRKHRVFAPVLTEQRQIAQILDTLDTQIHKTEALIAKLEKVKEGLLHDLLTRGIDENGRLRPSPDQAPELYKESPLGLIPREWSIAYLSDLLASVSPAMRSGPFGSALLKDELVESGAPLLGIDNVKVEEFSANFSRFITPEKFAELSRYAVRPNDIMITIMGTVGRCCIVPEGIGDALSSKHTWTLTLDQEKYSPFLAMLQINYMSWVLNHFSRDQQGGTMSAIRSETLASLCLPVPPRHEQSEIEFRLLEINKRLASEITALSKMRLEKSGLMDDLLTGRVRVTPLLDQARATTPA
ncbi:restriction endonuclease subunit S [Halomonas sp. ML-15]|uniref:restriction endonuclease subunit S n=1 Tax=Halomonas sp. ML-15 TaxID=2773305 RepID=UPI001746658D|nr:restriction endonuclease subunit S [Halomonas sp. ML-15]MBD3895452.1 restriction endonuclease subunit S [Halomonas sp. ML-15]